MATTKKTDDGATAPDTTLYHPEKYLRYDLKEPALEEIGVTAKLPARLLRPLPDPFTPLIVQVQRARAALQRAGRAAPPAVGAPAQPATPAARWGLMGAITRQRRELAMRRLRPSWMGKAPWGPLRSTRDSRLLGRGRVRTLSVPPGSPKPRGT